MFRVIEYSLVAFTLLLPRAATAEEQVDCLKHAKGAATWILSLSENRENLRTWPVNDTGRKAPAYDLYYGMPGGILLIAELAKEDPSGPFAKALAESLAGLESLKVQAPVSRSTEKGTLVPVIGRETWGTYEGKTLKLHPGLYNGVSGIAWLYLELYRLTGEARYQDRARSIVETLLDRGLFQYDSTLWDNSTDIISGAAGTGLFFLRADAVFKNARCRVMAERAGDFVLGESIPTIVGLKWKINSGTDIVYPNFAHGTAGVGYFLVRLYEATNRSKYIVAARRAVRQLEFDADENEKKKTCAWFHHEGDGEDLWYAGWCHGPAGTARLFYELSRAKPGAGIDPFEEDRGLTPMVQPRGRQPLQYADSSKNPMAWVECAANWLAASGIPEPAKPIRGFWNEGICCGTAGVGEFFVDLYLATKKAEYLKAAEKMALHLAKVAEPAGGGYRWSQAEDRVAPQRKDAQTGYAQGAAGIGLFFLKLARAERGERAGWQLPDNPF